MTDTTTTTGTVVPVMITMTVPEGQYLDGYGGRADTLTEYVEARLDTMPDDEGGESTPTVTGVVVGPARTVTLSDEALRYLSALVAVDGGENAPSDDVLREVRRMVAAPLTDRANPVGEDDPRVVVGLPVVVTAHTDGTYTVETDLSDLVDAAGDEVEDPTPFEGAAVVGSVTSYC